MTQSFIGSCPQDGKQYDAQCARCGSSVDWIDCEECGGDGYVYHDCGEDTCCCLNPEDNVPCDLCRGNTGWYRCLSSPEWCNGNPLDGRQDVKRGEIEWYEVNEQ